MEIGQQVILQVWNPKTKEDEWSHTGTVVAIVPAEDRPYRIDVEGNGYYWRGCAPECVRAV